MKEEPKFAEHIGQLFWLPSAKDIAEFVGGFYNHGETGTPVVYLFQGPGLTKQWSYITNFEDARNIIEG